MEPDKKKSKKTEKAEVRKQNQDFPNIPASSARHNEKTAKKEIHQTSKLHEDGNTDNTDKES